MKTRIAAALLLASSGALAEPNPLGVQLWSLKDHLEGHVGAGLDLVRSLGFTVVESASVDAAGSQFGLTPREFRALADARGIRIIGSHFPYERLLNDLPHVVDDAKVLGISYVIVPWIPHEGAFTAAKAHETAANLNRIGAGLRAAGLTFGFHTHGYEFKPLSDGSCAYDILLRETDPNLVCVEMDVFWVASGGADPVTLLRQYPGRYRLFHVKDIRKGALTGGTTGHSPIEDNVVVGQGRLDWPAILAAGAKAGVVWSIVEDETKDPVGNIPKSLRYLKTLGMTP